MRARFIDLPLWAIYYADPGTGEPRLLCHRRVQHQSSAVRWGKQRAPLGARVWAEMKLAAGVWP